MKLALVIASAFAIVMAENAGQGGYSQEGVGGFSSFGGPAGYTLGGGNSVGGSGPSQSYGSPGLGGGLSSGFGTLGVGSAGGASSGSGVSQGPQVFRYVSVHTAPADPDDEVSKVIRIPGGNNKHVNIIFVKAPSNGGDQKTEVVLPEPDEQKTLVYLLVQKSDAGANLKIRKPQAKQPSKPEVYFIRYKNAPEQAGQGQQANGQGPVAGAIGIRGFSRDASVSTSQFSGGLSSAYGAPSAAYGAP